VRGVSGNRHSYRDRTIKGKITCFMIRSVPRMDGQGCRYERLLLGLTGRWRFAEKAVGSACWNVRFVIFRTVTFDTLQSFEIPAIGQSEDYLVCLLKALFAKPVPINPIIADTSPKRRNFRLSCELKSFSRDSFWSSKL
jgi:hypothetical protein